MSKLIAKLKERSELPDRTVDKGIVNPETGSSVILNSMGNITIASSNNVQYKLNYASGQAREVSLESRTITNRKTIKTHKGDLSLHFTGINKKDAFTYDFVGNDKI